jgi:hypothetical protein
MSNHETIEDWAIQQVMEFFSGADDVLVNVCHYHEHVHVTAILDMPSGERVFAVLSATEGGMEFGLGTEEERILCVTPATEEGVRRLSSVFLSLVEESTSEKVIH